MDIKLVKKLKKKYPKLLLGTIECQDGWYDLIDKLSGCIQNYRDQNSTQVVQPKCDYIKEKFGGLRYGCTGEGRIFGMIWFAEYLSYTICEKCGKPGKLRSDRLWYKTFCKDCENEREIEYKKLLKKRIESSSTIQKKTV